MHAPSGHVTVSTLQGLLKDGTLAGDWVLDPGKSSIRLKNKSMWGLMPVNGVFREFTGNGTIAPDGEVSGIVTVAAALARWQPSLVINAAAYTNVDLAETNAEEARRGNEIGPAVLANASAIAGIAERDRHADHQIACVRYRRIREQPLEVLLRERHGISQGHRRGRDDPGE